MDSENIEKLGSRMRDVYGDVAAAPTGEVLHHPSTRLRKNRYITRVAAAKAGMPQAARSTAQSAAGSARGFVQQRPFTTLLVAAGAGYVLARLAR